MSLDKPYDPFSVAGPDQKGAGESSRTEKRLYPVDLPSGATLEVPTQGEAKHLAATIAAYADQYGFENVSDLSELDRCIGLELLTYRINVWLGRGKDYDNKSVDDDKLQQRFKDLSAELRQTKKGLGIDKVSRDRISGKGSTAEYLMNTLAAAGRFGVMRDEMSAKAITLAMEALSLVDVHKNSTEKERRIFGYALEDILEWLDTTFREEFTAIDAEFRERENRMFRVAS